MALMTATYCAWIRFTQASLPFSPDGVLHWQFVRALLRGDQITGSEFTHHDARWGVNVPALIVAKLFGTNTSTQYIVVFGFCALLALAMYRVGSRMGRPAIAVIAPVLLLSAPFMSMVGSNVLPTIFETTYLLGALCALDLAFTTRKRGWVIGGAVLAFVGYLAKETSVFLIPGLLLFLWLTRKSVLDLLFFCGSFAGLVALETFVYRHFFGLPFGRVSVITQHHLGNAKLSHPIRSLGGFLGRLLELPPGFAVLMWFALLVTAIALFRRVRFGIRVPALVLGVMTCAWSQVFLTTFAVKSIRPLLPAQPPKALYYMPSAAFLALIVAWGCVTFIRIPKSVPRWARLDSIRSVAVFLLAIGLLLPTITGFWQKDSLVAKARRFERLTQAAFLDGTPIVAPGLRATYGVRSVRALLLTPTQARDIRSVRVKHRGEMVSVVVNRRLDQFSGAQGKLVPKLTTLLQGRYLTVTDKPAEVRVEQGSTETKAPKQKGKRRKREHRAR
jgi:Dolichyl-phosphate-mannose-protein mannosyltransferase